MICTLHYRSFVDVDDLALNECTVHAAQHDGARWWHLWFHVARDSDGQPDTFVVPVNPGGPFRPDGPGGKTWSLRRSGPDTWQISPSINVLDTREVHPGFHSSLSLWHQTPTIVGVPGSERWTTDVP